MPRQEVHTGGAMESNRQRIEEFKEELASMDLRPPEDANERLWLIAGMVLPVLGLVAILIGWWGASGTVYPAEQFPYLISGGMLGLGLIIAGAALFVRYSLTRYVRFWLIRMVYEQRAQTDRSVEVLQDIESILRAATRSRQKVD
ncbi:hypothetical protein [Rhabdothermincola sp.]|uniref:hypothetical protein n=1 Tax=Rhabdothermincola sp. TaxID=2820405 RepID=UPI002FDF162E